MYKTAGKRFFDVLGSALLLCLLSPAFVVISVWGLFAYRGNPFFVQERIGLNEKVFKLIKFKTMNDQRGADGKLLSDRDRLSRHGRMLRRASLDEIPQLLNVLKGDMSFIGPRPLLVRYLPYYSDFEKQRHTVRPGITGLAQTSGRNELAWASRFSYDVEYVLTLSLMNDLKILFRTVSSVASASGVAADVTVTDLKDLDDERRG